MPKTNILGDCFGNKLLPEPIPFLLEALIGQTQNRAICGEFDNVAVIGKPWIVVVMQVCRFAIDGIEMSKFMPEEPAEVFVTVIGQKILADEDCIALLSKYIFHNGIFRKFSFLAGKVVYKLGPKSWYKNKKPLCSFITRAIGILFPITQLITPHRGIFL